MTEKETVTAHLPITISIDVEQLIKAELGWRTRTMQSSSYVDDDDGDYEYVPGDGRIIDVVADKVASKIQSQVVNDVRAAIKEKALEKVDGLIEKMMSEPLTLTSSYGEPIAPEMLMREAMIKAMSDRLNQQVDKNGKPHDRSISFGADRGYTYIAWRAEQVARDVMDKELSAKLAEAAKAIKTAATDLIGKRIADVLGRGL